MTVVDPTIPTKIGIEQGTALTVYIGKPDVQLSVTAEPLETASKEVKWKSAKPKIVKVGSDGTLTPVKAGTAKITATSTKNKKAKATITVTVVDLTVPVGLKLTAEKTELAIGETVAVKCELLRQDPEVPAVGTVTWTSSSKKTAKVDKDGNVTGLKGGTVTITAAVGKVKETIQLTVKTAGSGETVFEDVPDGEPEEIPEEMPKDVPDADPEAPVADPPAYEEWNDWYGDDDTPDLDGYDEF